MFNIKLQVKNGNKIATDFIFTEREVNSKILSDLLMCWAVVPKLSGTQAALRNATWFQCEVKSLDTKVILIDIEVYNIFLFHFIILFWTGKSAAKVFNSGRIRNA